MRSYTKADSVSIPARSFLACHASDCFPFALVVSAAAKKAACGIVLSLYTCCRVCVCVHSRWSAVHVATVSLCFLAFVCWAWKGSQAALATRVACCLSVVSPKVCLAWKLAVVVAGRVRGFCGNVLAVRAVQLVFWDDRVPWSDGTGQSVVCLLGRLREQCPPYFFCSITCICVSSSACRLFGIYCTWHICMCLSTWVTPVL